MYSDCSALQRSVYQLFSFTCSFAYRSKRSPKAIFGLTFLFELLNILIYPRLHMLEDMRAPGGGTSIVVWVAWCPEDRITLFEVACA